MLIVISYLLLIRGMYCIVQRPSPILIITVKLGHNTSLIVLGIWKSLSHMWESSIGSHGEKYIGRCGLTCMFLSASDAVSITTYPKWATVMFIKRSQRWRCLWMAHLVQITSMPVAIKKWMSSAFWILQPKLKLGARLKCMRFHKHLI